ncbi:hypothetical protein A3G67_04820 [Candidatus Roizmanbacteria bacterium RIFCSPLOWO2_12_FULL_40_12]|uniref:Aminotransferase class V domain-containing protein n=1 Tax=Candidatus Roizmanbacteria bacterium RIFCSPLOWO2_01_FULL_40_42 TaxID=1802066 RepID=A0A1F7J4K8_9BACT|nr:MAG: hypothetical protein A2779_04330 [Candidatus Roizmanbacteria bacterium RIFCSPHIGHO2_01_FULL_40_98]OGK27303.1 MAG: hypothetical protein A3C31_04655 [Candidatus Roizmanbacteria bacterium RIFCSPHIGHO2_02_FULL_40_53]OGK30825.1 MAG: hypothetical protein A2W49_02385 [Candidatus Roizmanbacteria bacterium RIFCSPHIGHO2_12_41_18]OGK36408.1 MAG: hypothetical protein A3E69_02280 [Candidatus Roizmanbacteria bacterium RIFCSPHIGHO2_12_FULL_40_130]OGK50536.1 MAG: hypothetical protein A3B50_02010 [Candi
MPERNRSLRIPGPTPLPDPVRQTMGEQMINHRGVEFHDLLPRVTERLKMFFQTQNDVFILTGSGTAGMEAAIANTLGPGSQALVINIGDFGTRFEKIANAFGVKTVVLRELPGRAASLDRIENAFNEIAENDEGERYFDAVLVTHNETSTGVTNDMEGIAKLVKKMDPETLLIVDSISSIPSIETKTDEWEIDINISGSQKGWGVAPALAIVSVSELALQTRSTSPKFYFDFYHAKEFLDGKNETPWTPAVQEIRALDTAIELILEEGYENFLRRHEEVGNYVRKRFKEMGLELYAADERCASDTITAVLHANPQDVVNLALQYGVELAGGQGALVSEIFRFGHMGFGTLDDARFDLDIVERAVRQIPNEYPLSE